MRDHLTPLEVCECLLAPADELERMAGYKRTAAHAWRRAAPNRRAGWLPAEVARKFWVAACLRDLPLKAEYLVVGAPRSEIEQLCRELGRPLPPPAIRQHMSGVAAE